MAKVKYDLSKVSRELLERYADQQLCVSQNNHAGSRIEASSQLGKEIVKAAEVQLRTRAEVDADIAKAVRSYAEWWVINNNSMIKNLSFAGTFGCTSDTLSAVFKKLLEEETSD